MKVREGEVVLADTCEPTSGLVFPLLETIVVTGVCWIAIGWMDANGIAAGFRNLVVALWAVLVVLRFVRPVVASRRRRFMVTNQRVLARSGSGGVDSIPLEQIHSVRRSRAGLSLWVHGLDRPLLYPAVGRAKKVQKILNGQVRSPRYR
ncbi:hypothetical protein [Corynebacterium auris]|uniref:hypothetical protein n=1 Tax=Corynebacterium auris TaxID=44750 RepID=UPI0025B54104|nr:hypothetical protein [Corynebacterium auris]WJY67468.1 hypothetical protein CAURIS_02720 [Corynebacterium auris]